MIQNSHENSKISVFGSTGFIGSNFCKLFNNESVQIDRSSREPETDNILYFISTTDNFNIFENPKKDIETNLSLLIDILQNCKSENVVFNLVSSWYVYGETSLPAREDSLCSPKGFYSITKKCAEDLLVDFCKTFGISYRILRLSNVYGIGDMNASRKKNALQFLTKELILGNPIHLYDGGIFSRDYMHVIDTCKAIYKVITDGDKDMIYNIGSGNEYQFKDLIDIVIRETGSTSKVSTGPAPDFYKNIQVKNMCLDVSRLSGLGFQCSTDISDGIADMCKKLMGEINVK